MTAKPWRPMLAADCEGKLDYFESLLKQVPYLLASRKIDGIRGTIINGVATSRSGKKLPNEYIQSVLLNPMFEHFDGELVSGSPCDGDVMGRAYSAVMTAGGRPDFRFYVFDDITDMIESYQSRLDRLAARVKNINVVCRDLHMESPVILVNQVRITELSQLIELEEVVLAEGYEGLIVRIPTAKYKNNRSTLREGGMVKVKRWKDSEAIITGFEEQLKNANEAFLDERGYQKRSSHKENMIPANTLGVFLGDDIHNLDWKGLRCIGGDHDFRKKVWDNREKYLGRIMKYKYLPIGTKELPRHPIFLGFRDPMDI